MRTTTNIFIVLLFSLLFISCTEYRDNFELKGIKSYVLDLQYDSELKKYYASEYSEDLSNTYSLLVFEFEFEFSYNPKYEYSAYDGSHGPLDSLISVEFGIKDTTSPECVVIDEESHYFELPYDPNELHSWVRELEDDSICGINESPPLKDLYNIGEKKGDIFLRCDPFYVVNKKVLRNYIEKNGDDAIFLEITTNHGVFKSSRSISKPNDRQLTEG